MARWCEGTTKKGRPCKMPAIGEQVDGEDRCLNHRPDAVEMRKKLGVGGPQPGAGRPKLAKATDILKAKVEADVDRVLKPLFDALEADKALIVQGNHKHPGRVEYVPDLPTRLRATADILDRVYGKAKQTTEVVGSGEDGAVRVELPRTPERAGAVASILAGAGALPTAGEPLPPHDGRRRRAAPATPAPAKSRQGNGNGTG